MPSRQSFDPSTPFTRVEGLGAGLTPWQLRGRDYVRIFHGVYVSARTPRTLAVRAAAALKAAPPGSALSHHTSVVLWGGSVPACSDIHVQIPQGETLRIRGIRAHHGVDPLAVRRWRGLPLVSPEATFVDLASSLDLVDLVVLGDSLVRRARTTRELLVSAASTAVGVAGRRAARAAALVRRGVDSVPESRLRLLMVLAGMPEPVVNHIIRDPETGQWLRRFELSYPELKLAIEYEGRHHRADDDVWAGDIDRREDLDRRSWRVIQVISTGLFDSPLRTLQRIEQARVDRGATPMTAFSEEWRPFFPGRNVA